MCDTADILLVANTQRLNRQVRAQRGFTQTERRQKIEDEIKNSPIAWFYTLEDSRRRGDFRRAAKAQQELERLGITVRYHDTQS